MLRAYGAVGGALFLGLSACILDNPGFTTGLGGTTSAGATTGSQSTTTAEGTTTTTTTTGGESTSTTTDGETTSGVSSTTTTTTTTSTTTTTTTTGEPEDCWDLDPNSWVVEKIDDASLGQSPRSVRISADGLSVVYVAEVGGKPRPHRAERASLDEPFLVGAPLAEWGALATGVDHPAMRDDLDELFLSGVGMDANDIVVSVVIGDAWTIPTPLTGVASGEPERTPSLTENGARLVHSRLVGPPQPYLGSPSTWRFYEAKRPIGSAPGAGFQSFAPVVLAGLTDAPYAHVFECPAIAPDGLHLLFGSSCPEALDANNASDALRMYITERAGVNGPWAEPAEITTLRVATWQLCPQAITRDGCQMTFARFKFPQDPNEPDPVQPFLARRGP
jgi:hypothetical protein